MDEGTRFDVIPDDVARRHEALLERVTQLERALEWIAEHETDEEAIDRRSTCGHEFHTAFVPDPDSRCPQCFSRWWATDGSLPSCEGSYALGAVAAKALDGGKS
jgi:predicted Zn-ribbon and HTH transcriptional regulator